MAASFGVAVVSVSATIGSAVATSVVAASSAAAGAGAAGGSTAGVATSGAGGGAAGGAAGGVTDITAVLLAMQRLSVLASMPVEKSELHASVGDILAWTKGSLGIFPWIEQRWNLAGQRDFKDPIERGDLRRLEVGAGAEPGLIEVVGRGNLEEKEELVNALDQLIDTFTTLGCALAAVLLVQLLVHLLWKHCINRKYYALRRQQTQKASSCLAQIWAFSQWPKTTPSPSSALRSGPPAPCSLCQTVPAARRGCWSIMFLSVFPTRTQRSNGSKTKIKFFPFPALLRWPTLPLFVCVCCLSGLLHDAMKILIHRKQAPQHALAFAIAALVIALGVLLLLWVQLILFARRHLLHMWVPERAPAAPSEVDDPALRLVSTARRRILTLGSPSSSPSSSPCSRVPKHLSSPVDAAAVAARKARWEQKLSESPSSKRSSLSLGAAVSRRSLVRIEQKPYLHRARGAFLAQGSREHESKDPERTERLLANPFALFPPTGQDAFESIAVTARS